MTRDQIITEFMRHQQMLKSFVGYMVPNRQDAEDLFQEAAVVILKKDPEQIRPDTDFIKWCRGVIRNLVRHYWHIKGKGKVTYMENLCDSVEAAYEEEDRNIELWTRRYVALQGCLEQVSPVSRSMLSRIYSEGIKMVDIAKELSCSAASLRVRIMRIRCVLLDCIEKHLSGEQVHG